MDHDILAGHAGQNFLDFILDGGQTGLDLPAVKGTAVVFYGEFEIFQRQKLNMNLQSVTGNVTELIFDNVIDQASKRFTCEMSLAGPATQKNTLSGALHIKMPLAMRAFHRRIIE